MNSNSEKTEPCVSCEYEENLGILREIDFFSGLSLESTKLFAYLCVRQEFKPGDFLFRQKDEKGGAYYIISGTARLSRRRDGEKTEIRDYGEGEFIGRLSLMANVRRLFSLQAMTDVTCLMISREKFDRALQQFPDQLPRMIQVIAEDIHKWEKRFFKERSGDCSSWMEAMGVSLI
jgi:CRP-like cAMP-binding protein